MKQGMTRARVTFKDGEYCVDLPGDYVECAVTGVCIPLASLKYWSVERQEAYISPAAALKKQGILKT